jgi:hypothetical protein
VVVTVAVLLSLVPEDNGRAVVGKIVEELFWIDHGSVTGVDEILNGVEVRLLGDSVALKTDPKPSSLADEDALTASVAEGPIVDSTVGPVPERLAKELFPIQL